MPGAVIKMAVDSLQVRFTISSHRFLDLLRRLGVIKEHGSNEAKNVFAVLGVIIVVGIKIFHVLCYAAFLLLSGAIIGQIMTLGGIMAFLDSDNILQGMSFARAISGALVVWFFISFAAGLFGVRSITAGSRNHINDETMISYFNADPATYAGSQIIIDRTVDLIMYLPLALIAFSIAGIPIWCVLPALIMLTSFRLIGEVVNLWLFKHTGRHLGYGFLYILGYALYIPAFIVPFFIAMPDITAVMSNPLIIVIALIPGILALFYIRKYNLYGELLRDKIHRNDLTERSKATSYNTGFSGLNFKDAQKWSKSIKTADLSDEKFRDKEGFAYMNAIFFDRQRKFFNRKLLKRILIVTLPVVAFSTFLLINPFFDSFDKAHDSFVNFFNFSPAFFAIVCLASMGRVITASIFTNCDVEMLNYPCYRTRENILLSFKTRFLTTLKYNALVTVVLAFSILVGLAALFRGMDFLYASVFFVLLLCLGVFFSFNDLFLYYVLQPYDSDGKSNNVMYTFLNVVVAMIAYFSYQVSLDLFIYTGAVAVITVAYLALGIYLIKTVAPKNFKLS